VLPPVLLQLPGAPLAQPNAVAAGHTHHGTAQQTLLLYLWPSLLLLLCCTQV
jgi:hypothetical protein